MENKDMRKPAIIYLSSIATIATLVLFKGDSLTITGLVALLSVFMLLADWNIGRLLIFMFIFALACATEILLAQTGVWTYDYQDIFGIPFWIPFVWVNGGFFFIQLKETIDRRLRTTRA